MEEIDSSIKNIFLSASNAVAPIPSNDEVRQAINSADLIIFQPLGHKNNHLSAESVYSMAADAGGRPLISFAYFYNAAYAELIYSN
jgi:hypothetical protein